MEPIEIHATRGESIAANTGTTLRITLVPGWLFRVRICKGRNSPLKATKYTLVYGSQRYKGQTDDRGYVEQKVKFEFAGASIIINNMAIPLEVSPLPSPDTVDGIQARLNNLGYECGMIDGVAGARTKAATRAFQREHPPLKVDGIAGPNTQQALFTAHGS